MVEVVKELARRMQELAPLGYCWPCATALPRAGWRGTSCGPCEKISCGSAVVALPWDSWGGTSCGLCRKINYKSAVVSVRL